LILNFYEFFFTTMPTFYKKLLKGVGIAPISNIIFYGKSAQGTKTPRTARQVRNRKMFFSILCFSWCLGALVVMMLLPLQAKAQESWVFLPSDYVFHPLIIDPREPHSAVMAYGTWDRFEGAIGDTIEFVQWKPGDGSRWAWGIAGASDIQLASLGDGVFPEIVSDWYLGTYFSESFGQFSNRLEYMHVSSHLGDSLFETEQRLIYSRETFKFTTSFDPSDQFRLYGGVGYSGHIMPADRPFYVHAGTELYSDYWPVSNTSMRGYFGYDVKFLEEAGGVTDQNFELGIQWKAHPEDHRDLRIAVSYYNGNSQYGQFYRQSDNHWGWAVYFDP
jgi:hypothetical protein